MYAAVTKQPDEDVQPLVPPVYQTEHQSLRPVDAKGNTSCHPLSCCLQTVCCPLTLGVTCFTSLFTLPVQQEAVILRYGRYERTVRDPGIHYSNIFGRTMRTVSTKLQSMDLPSMNSRRTVLDRDGNPLVVSAVVTYQFSDTYKAALEIENPTLYLMTQGESVLKTVVCLLPAPASYGAEDVAATLKAEIQRLVHVAGIHVHSFRLKEISYAPVIAAAMLKRQQAAAVVQARSAIVQGAVDISTTALESLKAKGVHFQPSEATQLVSNLLTVICSEAEVQPTLPLNVK